MSWGSSLLKSGNYQNICIFQNIYPHSCYIFHIVAQEYDKANNVSGQIGRSFDKLFPPVKKK